MLLEKGVTIIHNGRHYKGEIPDRVLAMESHKHLIAVAEKANKQWRDKMAEVDLNNEINEYEYEGEVDE